MNNDAVKNADALIEASVKAVNTTRPPRYSAADRPVARTRKPRSRRTDRGPSKPNPAGSKAARRLARASR